ncbi:hypothetical protein B0H12DRAFT_1240020 [Mycena haematopus]|nr:hypothetical protein B0H12DRAFT_1240020 [Mycena haematopus]
MKLLTFTFTFLALALAAHAGTLTLERQITECCLPEDYPCRLLVVSPPPEINCCAPFVCIATSTEGVGRCMVPPPP